MLVQVSVSSSLTICFRKHSAWKGRRVYSECTRSSQAFAIRKTGEAMFCNWKTKPQPDSSVNHYTGKITHSLISLLVLLKKNLIYEHGDLVQPLKMSLKGFAELCGAGICVHVLLCFCNTGRFIYLSVYINITVICFILQCNQEYLKKFITYSGLFSFSDQTFSSNSPGVKHNTSCLLI